MKLNENTISFHYINNPDKSIRWFFPSTNKSPTFLALYNNSGWKAKAYKTLIKFIYSIGIQSLASSGSFTVRSKQAGLHRFWQTKEVDEYAVFTGTAGKNRKTIVALFQNKNCSHFVKIPLTDQARKLVKNEHHQLKQLENIHLSNMNIPKAERNSEALCLTNVQPFDSVPTTEINEKHFFALKECYSKTQHVIHPHQLSSWQQIANGLQFLNSNKAIQHNFSKEKIAILTQHLNILFNEISLKNSFPVGLAHGDFTPWNMYESKDKIHVYDWEMASPDMPLFFDVFHYVFQDGILIKRNSFSEIKTQLQELSKHVFAKGVIKKYNIEWSNHYAFYLLYIVTYYLPLYVQQKNLHMQAHWLVNCWTEALVDLAPRREEVIQG